MLIDEVEKELVFMGCRSCQAPRLQKISLNFHPQIRHYKVLVRIMVISSPRPGKVKKPPRGKLLVIIRIEADSILFSSDPQLQQGLQA
jgi:hypothetical protein